MQFQLSHHWLSEFVDVLRSPAELAEQLSLHAASVERMHRMDDHLDRIVIGRVERIEPHPKADRLQVVRVAVGRTAHRVVCGGTNLRSGLRVAYAQPGAHVRWHGQGDLVELKPTDIRGVRSDGMICAASEIGLGEWFPEGEREILDLSHIVGSEAVGQSLAAALGLDDVIYEIEVPSNRPDLMSVMGLAREVAAITGARVRGRSRKSQVASRQRGSSARSAHTSWELTVRVEDSVRCPMYTGTVIDGVTVQPSPWWMQQRLIATGLRPINNVVDITNYVLLETGQPLHAFDAETLGAAEIQETRGKKQETRDKRQETRNKRQETGDNEQGTGAVEIVVRSAREGEELHALDGVTYRLTPETLVIASRPAEAPRGGGAADRPVAIAGIIGGQETGVTDQTRRIILEAAAFDAKTVRRAFQQLTVRTESSERFEKGLSVEGVEHARQRAVELFCEVTGGVVFGAPVVIGKLPRPHPPIPFRPEHASSVLGVALPKREARRALSALGCRVAGEGETWRVTPPHWRRGDLEAEHDLVEEVARIHGYHALPSVLPMGQLPAAVYPAQPPRSAFSWEARARMVLADLGGVEVLAYSMTSAEHVERCGYTQDQCVAIENPLTSDLALMRPALLPTTLPIIAQNQRHDPSGTIFEMGKVYVPQHRKQETGNRKQETGDRRPGRASPVLPKEEMRILVATYGRLLSGGHVMKLKGFVEHLFRQLGIRDAVFAASEQCILPSGTCRWHPGRTMDISIGETLVGILGEVHPTVVESFGIDQRVAVAELDWDALLAFIDARLPIESVPEHPAAKRDLAVIVDRRSAYANLAAVLAVAHPLLTRYELFDQYEGPGVGVDCKSLAFHLTYSAPDRTLTTGEVDAAHEAIITTLRERFGAEVRE